MSAARVGTVVRGGGGAATFHATSFPQAPTSGNLLLLAISSNRTTSAPVETVTDWTLLGSGSFSRAGVFTTISLFGKWSNGGESAPTITHSGSSTCTWTMEEWSGLAGTFPSGIPEDWSSTFANLSSGGTTTVNVNETADVDNEWVFVLFGGRISGAGDMLSAWDATDLVASSPTTATGRSAALYTATGAISTAAAVKNFEATAKASSQGDAVCGIGAVGFAVAGGGPVIQTPAVIRTGVEDEVAVSSVIRSGARDAATGLAVIRSGAEDEIS